MVWVENDAYVCDILLGRHHDNQPYDIQYIDTQHNGLFVTLSIDTQHNKIACHYDECHYAECHHFFVMLSVVMLNVIMVNVIMMNAFKLSVAAPFGML
jgi:hypothetical protein